MGDIAPEESFFDRKSYRYRKLIKLPGSEMEVIMEYILTLGLTTAIIAPLMAIYRKKRTGKKIKYALIAQIVCFFAICVLICGTGIGTALAADDASPAGAMASPAGTGMLAAAISTGMSCLGAGIAVAAAASAAIGAISENDKSFGKALIFVALAEGVALYGFLISFLILGRL